MITHRSPEQSLLSYSPLHNPFHTAGEADSDDEEDDDLEAAQLEKMVAKLARIVKHVIPNRSIELDENVDKNTSNWLAQVGFCACFLHRFLATDEIELITFRITNLILPHFVANFNT